MIYFIYLYKHKKKYKYDNRRRELSAVSKLVDLYNRY